MKQQNWKQITRVLEDVLAIDLSERQNYLDSLSIDPDIKKEVELLLTFENDTDSTLDKSTVKFSNDFLSLEKENTLVGQNFGIYEIVKEIGFGGMGAVYLAKRIDGKFEQKVAIKMLRRDFNTEKLRERFRRERKIQASLVHPNIATLLDAGMTDYGIPYLVMEYVEGNRIDKFCTENKLNLNESLKLFNKVCDAVSFAHRNLIIHRDIKPSNIIVTKKGEPKLLDFGISKLIDADIKDKKTVTKLGALTPEYASPEQVQGEIVTTATDIYSLGVVLFNILTGDMPFDTENQTDSKIFSEIANSHPKKPSEAKTGKLKFQVTNQKLLKGDLDNIILKSLRKEPERRYTTVEQFAGDIWRYIDGLPVIARPSTFYYRASKFYQRNKIQVVASALIGLSLVTGVVLALWLASIAKEQARIATESQQVAEKESAKSKVEEERAKKITKFMEKIISYANPGAYAEGYKYDGEAKVIDVLKEMSSKIESDFPNQLDIQAELHHKFAEVFVVRRTTLSKGKTNIVEQQKADYHARRAIELRRKHYGNKHELVAKDMYYLWSSRSPLVHDPVLESKLLAEAIQMMRETNLTNLNLPHMLASYSNRLYDRTNTQEVRTNYYLNALPKPKVGRLELAENIAKESLQLFQTHHPKDEYAINFAKCNVAMSQIERTKFEEAEKNFQGCHKHYTYYTSHKAKDRYQKYKLRLEVGLTN